MTTTPPRPGLRERKRLQSMRRVQEVALTAFEEHGFDAVAVERIAAEAEVSPISVYRWFGSKEGIVLWDDYDPALFEAIDARLESLPPLEAIRDGVVAELDRVYRPDRELVLRRTRLIHREPALLAAAVLAMREMQAALGGLLARVVDGALARTVLAGAATAALAAAIEHWQERDGEVALAELVGEAFAALEGIRWTS